MYLYSLFSFISLFRQKRAKDQGKRMNKNKLKKKKEEKKRTNTESKKIIQTLPTSSMERDNP